MRKFPSSVEIFIKTSAPAEFFARELEREYSLVSDSFDTGAAQLGNFAIDWEKTFHRALALQRKSVSLVRQEKKFLSDNDISAVVADVPSIPLVAAREAGLPAIAIANFTWIEILSRAAGSIDERLYLLRMVRDQYACAGLALKPGFSFPMTYFPHAREIELIAPRGRNVRRELARAAQIDSSARIVLLYFGNWGRSELPFERLGKLRNVQFISLSPMEPPVVPIDPRQFAFEDIVASVDAVLAKPGYGTMAQCMANATPVVYYPRPEFAEYFVMRRELENWGGAVRMSRRDFLECRWQSALELAFGLHPDRVPCRGAQQAADEILKIAGVL
jgi:hypothetical protein